MSRTPVRAALQKLESDGLVSIRAKQGCFVRPIDILQVSHYYDVRVAIESLIIDALGKQKEMSALERLAVDWCPRTARYGLQINDALKAAEERFHLELAIAARNPVLQGYLSDINDHIRVVRRLGWPDTKSVTDTYEEHHAVCQLILKRHLKKAKAEMTHHIRKSQDVASRITLKQIYGATRASSVFDEVG